MKNILKTALVSIVYALLTTPGCSSSQKPAAGHLKFIPADSWYVYTNLQPRKLVEDFPFVRESMKGLLDRGLLEDMEKEVDAKKTPTPFVARVLFDYFKALARGESPGKAWGIKETGHFSIYSVAGFAVVRLDLADAAATKQYLANLSKEGVEPVVSQQGPYQIHRYEHKPANGNAALKNSGILVAIGKSDLVLTFAGSSINEDLLARLLGIVPPNNPLSGKKLVDYARQYGFDTGKVGYVNHVEIARSLLHEKDAHGHEALALLDEMADARLTGVQKWRNDLSAQCRQEFIALVSAVPATVFGVKRETSTKKSYRAELGYTIEIANAFVAEKIRVLQGNPPPLEAASMKNVLYAVTAGLKLDELGNVVGDLLQEFHGKTYQCEHLKKLQQLSTAYNPTMWINMATGMFRGMVGFALVLEDMEIKSQVNGTADFDGLMIVATKNPAILIASVSQMLKLRKKEGYRIPKINEIARYKQTYKGKNLDVGLLYNEKNVFLFTGKKAEQRVLKNRAIGFGPERYYTEYFGIGRLMRTGAQQVKQQMARAQKDKPETAGSMDKYMKDILEILESMNWTLYRDAVIHERGMSETMTVELGNF